MARSGLASIRWKLFALISCAVAAPVVALTFVLQAREVAAIEDGLVAEALTFARIDAKAAEPAVAFADAQSAREELGSTATDRDLVFAAIFGANGSLLASTGTGDLRPPEWTDLPVVAYGPTRVRAVAPVISAEGPRGLVVIELSTQRVAAAAARVRRIGLLAGLAALAAGCIAAWIVGSSLGKRIGRVERRALRVADGDLSAEPIGDDSADEIGQLARVFQGMVRVVEQKVAERTAEVERSRAQYEALLEATGKVPWERTRDGRFTYLGPQAAKVLGIHGDAWRQPELWRARIPAEDLAAWDEAVARAHAGGGEEQVEVRYRRDDGRTMWLLAFVAAAERDGELRPCGLLSDVTEQRELELELRQAQKLESVGRLASGVAHEINTPVQYVGDNLHFLRSACADLLQLVAVTDSLRPALGAAGLVESIARLDEAEADADLTYLEENIPRALACAGDGLERVTTIVRSLRAFAHPDQVERAPADVNRALVNTLTIANSEYKYVADIDTDLGDLPPVLCQIGELNQAFLNVIVNAAHAIGDVVAGGGGRGRITVTTRHEGDWAIIRIADTGGGIPDAIRARIFDLFFTTKQVGRGTGQGLAIARSIVDKHGGSIAFDSEIGRGTTFTIRIPIGGTEAERSAA